MFSEIIGIGNAEVNAPPQPGVKTAARRGLFSYYHGWNIVSACVLAQVAGLALTLNCFSLFLADWTREFGAPVSLLALAPTLFSACVVVISPMSGWAAERFPARWVFAIALAGLVLFHALMGFVTHAWQLIALYVTLLPFAIPFSASVPSQSLVSRWFVRRIGLAIGLTAFGLALAGAIFPPIIQALLPLMGWRKVWWLFAAAIAVICIPVALLVMRDQPTEAEGAHYVGSGQEPLGASTLTAAQVFRRRNFWILIGVFTPVQLASMGISINLAPIVTSHGFTTGTAAAMISLSSVAALIAKLAVGAMSDRMGNRIPLVLVALLGAAGTLLLAFQSGSLPMLLTATAISGFSSGVWTLLASATNAEFGAKDFGRAFGIVCAFTPIGALAPPIVARLNELSGNYVAGLRGLGLLCLLAAIAALFLKERRAA